MREGEPLMQNQERESTIAGLLIDNREVISPDFWYWLRTDRDPTKRDANKFFLACILDYQILARTAWGNAKRLAEDIFDDPENLWETITAVDFEAWQALRSQYSLHRFSAGHRRVWSIGNRIVHQYGGDVRNIWQNQSIEATLSRVSSTGAGEQITRMIVGALIDTHQITGIGDVKADIHVCRVLGRALTGDVLTPVQATNATRRMCSENPWLLDRPLFTLGQQNKICTAGVPKCSQCYLRLSCAYYDKTQSQESHD